MGWGRSFKHTVRAQPWLVRYWAYEDSKYVHVYAPTAQAAQAKAQAVLRQRWKDLFGYVDIPEDELPEFALARMAAVRLEDLRDGDVLWD